MEEIIKKTATEQVQGLQLKPSEEFFIYGAENSTLDTTEIRVNDELQKSPFDTVYFRYFCIEFV